MGASAGAKHCVGGRLDPALFEGLTQARVNIKMALGGEASDVLANCFIEPCRHGMHFDGLYVEAENPMDFITYEETSNDTDVLHGAFYVVMLAMSDKSPLFKSQMEDLDPVAVETHESHHHKDKRDKKGNKDEDDEKDEK